MSATTSAAGTGETEPLAGLTPRHMVTILQETGCRAEVARAPDGSEMVASALHGTGFTVRFVNAYAPNPHAASQSTEGFSDISFVHMPRIDGLPQDAALPPWIGHAVADWNTSRRFAHLALISHEGGRFLALRWDLLVLGVTRDHLHASVHLWDQLMQEFFAFLRNRAGTVQQSDTPVQTRADNMRQDSVHPADNGADQS